MRGIARHSPELHSPAVMETTPHETPGTIKEGRPRGQPATEGPGTGFLGWVPLEPYHLRCTVLGTPRERLRCLLTSALVCVPSHVRLFVSPWTAAFQASPGFPRQEHWSGLPFPPPGDLPPGKPLSVLELTSSNRFQNSVSVNGFVQRALFSLREQEAISFQKPISSIFWLIK